MAIRKQLNGVSASALALALIGGIAPVAVQAQDATGDDGNAGTTTEDNTIVVTGIRAAIDNSVAQKRENTSIVEVVSAEDLGKLPDQSIAESLSRLPGLATQRLDGRANVASIRGLAPDFTTTLLNGREQVSANNNRGVELDQYPSELLNGAVVYKTPDAMLVGQALGGTIDLKSVRPLSYSDTQIVIGLRGEMNDLGRLNPDISDKGYRANISYVGQNADGTLGWAIGYARMESPTQEKRWNAWGYPNVDADTQVIGGAKPYVKSNRLKRDGLMGVLEWEPSDRVHLTLDGYWSRFKDQQRLRGIELPLFWSAAQLQPGFTEEKGLVTSGRYTGVEAVMRNDVVNRNSEIWAGGFNGAFKATDTLTLELDLSYSKLNKTEENLEIYLGTGRGGGVGATDSLGFTMPAKGGVITFNPTLNYADPSLFVITDPQGWNSCGGSIPNCQDGFVNRPRVRDRLQSIRLQAIKALDGALESVTVGANYSDRRKQLIDEGFVLNHKNYPANTRVPADYLFEPVSLDFIGIPGMVAFDSWRYYNDGNYKLIDASAFDTSRLTNRFVVREKVLTGFVQANFNSGPVRGNTGVQFVRSNQEADSFAATFGPTGAVVSTPITDGDTYNSVLPSLNLSFEFANQAFIRFGAARMLARTRMDRLNPSVGYNYSAANNVPGQTPWSGTVGNAKLRPIYANTIDLAVEKYFGSGGYVSLGGFYKYVENWVYRQNTIFDFSGITPPPGQTPVTNLGLVSQWQNARGGQIKGAEASFSLPFDVLTPSLGGFGILGSASYTESSVREQGPDPISMPGLSKWVANGTVYFEKSGFQARASGRYRSSFLAEVATISLQRDLVMARGEFIVDAQIGYTFQSGALQGLGILFTGSNLTNEPFVTYYNNDERQVRDYQNYGRNFMVGLTYRF